MIITRNPTSAFLPQRAMKQLLLLILLALLVPRSAAVLQNSFCSQPLNGLPLPAPSNLSPYFSYSLSSLCLTWTTSSNYTISLAGLVYQNNLPLAISAQCNGVYYWANPQDIIFALPSNAPSYCTQTSGPGYCNWACEQFAGTYIPFFDSVSAPMQLVINPSTAGINWGSIVQPIPLFCNTSSCGSATGLVPNLQQNVTYTVRRSPLQSQNRYK